MHAKVLHCFWAYCYSKDTSVVLFSHDFGAASGHHKMSMCSNSKHSKKTKPRCFTISKPQGESASSAVMMLFHGCCCWAIPEWILILYICQRKGCRWNSWLCVHLLITSNHDYQFNCSTSSWDQCHLSRDPEHPKLKRRNRETRQPQRTRQT